MSISFKTWAVAVLAVSILLTPHLIPSTTYQVNASKEITTKAKIPEGLLRAGFCETQLRHVSDSGDVVRGKENPQDIGIFQLNLRYHLLEMRSQGLNPFKRADNIKYAQILYKQRGAKD